MMTWHANHACILFVAVGAGVGAALLLSLLTYVSFSYFKKSQRCKLAVFASLGEFHSRDAVILNQSIIH